MYNFKKHRFVNCEQIFYKINKNGFESLKELHRLDETYDEVRISDLLIDWIDKDLRFANAHRGFRCGMTKLRFGKEKYFFYPMLFYKKGSEWIRVGLETTGCSACDWRGTIANPVAFDLYISFDNRYELMNKAAQIETVPCPRCNKRLKQRAIWVETDNK